MRLSSSDAYRFRAHLPQPLPPGGTDSCNAAITELTPDRMDTVLFGKAESSADEKARRFLEQRSGNIERLEADERNALLELMTSGSSDAEKRLGLAKRDLGAHLQQLATEPDAQSILKPTTIQKVEDNELRRTLLRLEKMILSNPPGLSAKSSSLLKGYQSIPSTYVHEGKELSKPEVKKQLAHEKNPETIRQMQQFILPGSQFIPEGSKQTLEEMLKNLVAERNQFAHKAGYDNYYDMVLDKAGLGDGRVEEDVANLLTVTRLLMHELPLFSYQKGVRKNFEDFDALYAGISPEVILEKTGSYLNKNPDYIASLIERSDLYQDPKRPDKLDGYCGMGDDHTDVRILMTMTPSLDENMDTDSKILLHEFGHANDFSSMASHLQPLLAAEADLNISEGHAKLMEMLKEDPAWVELVLECSPEKAKEIAKQAQLDNAMERVQSLHYLMMRVEFERKLYRSPEQDLDELWDNLSKKYYAGKYFGGKIDRHWSDTRHLFVFPTYQHQYFYGDLWRAQLVDRLKDDTKTGWMPAIENRLQEVRREGTYGRRDEIAMELTGEPISTVSLIQNELSPLAQRLLHYRQYDAYLHRAQQQLQNKESKD